MAVALSSTYLMYLFKVRLQLEAEGRTQWLKLQLLLPPFLLLSIFSFSQLLECEGIKA